MIDFSKKKYFIWDWNGTIVDDVALCHEIITEILVDHGLAPISIDDYRRAFAFPIDAYYSKLGLPHTGQSYAQLTKRFALSYAEKRNRVDIFPGIKSLLKQCHVEGIEHCILSAYRQNPLESMVKHFDMTQHFSHIVGLSDTYRICKINRGLELMTKLNDNGGKVLMIGDTLHDAEVAKAMGVDCLLIAQGHNHHDVLVTSGQKVIHDLSAFADVLTSHI